MAMVFALLGIYIEDFPLVRWQICRILQYLVILQRCRNDGGNVECLFALGFPVDALKLPSVPMVEPFTQVFRAALRKCPSPLDGWFSKGLQNPLSAW